MAGILFCVQLENAVERYLSRAECENNKQTSYPPSMAAPPTGRIGEDEKLNKQCHVLTLAIIVFTLLQL
jgi:hypothetical protein